MTAGAGGFQVTRPYSLARKLLHYTLHLPVATKVPVLLTTVILLSSVSSLGFSPDSWLAERRNPINTHLLKWSWGWTLLCLCPSVMITSCLYTGLDRLSVLRHVSRLLVAHCVWYSMTSVFVVLDSFVGQCDDGSANSRAACVRDGRQWSGFDISGHVFLLTYCVYVLTEEAANLRVEVWYEYNGSLEMEQRALLKLSSRKDFLPHMHRLCSPLAGALELLATAEVLLWTVMVGATSLYFHSFLEKVLGFICGYVAWNITYCRLYGHSYLPCRPDEGLLHPLKHMPNPQHSTA